MATGISVRVEMDQSWLERTMTSLFSDSRKARETACFKKEGHSIRAARMFVSMKWNYAGNSRFFPSQEWLTEIKVKSVSLIHFN